ncbi:MAG: hypothetical protein LBM93_05705 [Oscillospiraceae bacterium]|jgi:DNA polymerase-1|nr:hypothetical protein [Oscillospiraceae bacterium]
MEKRVTIFDFSHLAWQYAFSKVPAMNCTLKVDGKLKTVDTTIPTYTIKAIHRWVRCNPVAVCFDLKGCSGTRASYFSKIGVGYKVSRGKADNRLYEGIDLTKNCLMKGGISCYSAPNFEADDLIKVCLERIKKDYPDNMIDIVTGDSDLLPLVDDRVSVYIKSTKTTYAESKNLEHNHYVQVTPRNYNSYIRGLTAFKGLDTEYNTVLLAKILRGDKPDNIKGIKGFTPTRYNALIESLRNDSNVDIQNAFRYGVSGTFEYFNNLLGNWCSNEEIEQIAKVYTGMNLNGDLGGLRQVAYATTPIQGYHSDSLQNAVNFLGIKLF